MLSKNKIKYIRSLELKKNRRAEGVFVAEGPKVVGDLLDHGLVPVLVAATSQWQPVGKNLPEDTELYEVDEETLRKVSFLQHPQQVIAVFRQPSASLSAADVEHRLCLALDGVQDPGNLGTIIRVADWFGIDTIVCSPDCADQYNPKVVQATMGSIARVRLCYTDLSAFIDRLPDGYPVYGTLLNGENIYAQQLTHHGMIVMGNEGNGISEDIRKRVNRRLYIPCYQQETTCAESLNVAIATAVVCAEFRKQTII